MKANEAKAQLLDLIKEIITDNEIKKNKIFDLTTTFQYFFTIFFIIKFI